MNKLRPLLLPLILFASLFTRYASADTIDFTVTITSASGGPAVIPIGTVYTGFVHYDGSVPLDFQGYPPALTSFGFDFPGTPTSLSDMAFAFVQRDPVDTPMFAELGYYALGTPYGSYWLLDKTFEVFTTTDPGGSHSWPWEDGTVTYTYISDPSVPEPAPLFLLGTGVLALVVGGVRRRLQL